MRMQLPYMLDGEWPFIEGEFVAVQEDDGIIIGQPNKEAVDEDCGETGENGDSTVTVGDQWRSLEFTPALR